MQWSYVFLALAHRDGNFTETGLYNKIFDNVVTISWTHFGHGHYKHLCVESSGYHYPGCAFDKQWSGQANEKLVLSSDVTLMETECKQYLCGYAIHVKGHHSPMGSPGNQQLSEKIKTVLFQKIHQNQTIYLWISIFMWLSNNKQHNQVPQIT